MRAGKAEEEVEELVKKSQQLEVELDKTLEELDHVISYYNVSKDVEAIIRLVHYCSGR